MAGRTYTPQIEIGGEDEQNREVNDPPRTDAAPPRIYAASELGGPDELARAEDQEREALLATAEAEAEAPAEEPAPAEDVADVEAEVRESLEDE